MLRRLKSRLVQVVGPTSLTGNAKDGFNTSDEACVLARKIQQQRVMRNRITGNVWLLRIFLSAVGFSWLLLLPLDMLGKGTYVDEHAIQPAQVTTYWDWGDVHTSDLYLNDLERLWSSNATSQERSDHLYKELKSLGLHVSTQAYSFETSSQIVQGINTYAYLAAPRSSGTEAILMSAPIHSLLSTTSPSVPSPNLRGVALLLAIAKFLRGQNHWAKEFIFLFPDGEKDGIEAFLAAYHGVELDGLTTASLDLPPQGVIWQALNIDYPGHSFSHVGLFYEGINGRLTNQDLLNSVAHISRWTGYAPVRLYDLREESDPVECPSILPSFLCKLLQSQPISEYKRGALHIAEHFKYAALGRSSGGHGSFAKYRIDAVTLFAVPATGPHGFHCLGIIIESSLRSLSNILERLHASYFFYILPRSGQFSAVGSYLPAAILLGASITIGGLDLWMRAGWVLLKFADDSPGQGKELVWRRRARELQTAVTMLVLCFAVGVTLLCAIGAKMGLEANMFLLATLLLTPTASWLISKANPLPPPQMEVARTACLALSHLLAGAVISTLAMLNFPQAVLTAALLGPPLWFAETSLHQSRLPPPQTATPSQRKSGTLAVLALLSPGGLALLCLTLPFGMGVRDVARDLLADWQVLGSYFIPGLLGICWPLQLVASVVVWLS